MILEKDSFGNLIVPSYMLCKASRERIGSIICTTKTYDKKFNDISEITFETPLYINEKLNPIYDEIVDMKFVEVPQVGFFYISSIETNSEGTRLESKTVTVSSYEGLMGQKYLDTFSINMGTVESIDEVQFYNPKDPTKSLLHLVLSEKCPEWSIGHVDPELMELQRSFEISRQDIYSFLMDDVSNAFECFFIFNTLSMTINVYKESNYGFDTSIHVSYSNLLLNKVEMAYSVDDIKTCLELTGEDELTLREINMGFSNLINIEYYNSLNYFSKGLYENYNKWKALRDSKLEDYTEYLSHYIEYQIQINYLTYEKFPESLDSTDWSEYGLNPLQERLAVYKGKQSLSIANGHSDPNSNFYEIEYLPIYNEIVAIEDAINNVKSQIQELEVSQSVWCDQMVEIIQLVALENNFTSDQIKELSAFIREEELSSDNFVITDIMTEEERFEMLQEMLKYGQAKLEKMSTPQLSFTATMNNLYLIPDFDIYSSYFDVGNYIWVTLRDNYSIKAKLLSIHINYLDPTDFSCTFGNIVRKGKTIYSPIQEAINTATSTATSVSAGISSWNQAVKDVTNLNQAFEEGIINAGKFIGNNADLLIDKQGIFITATTGEGAGKDSILIGSGGLFITDDNFESTKTVIGRVTIKDEEVYGVCADAVKAGYIEGTEINNGNGTFTVDADGEVVMMSGSFGGENGFKIDGGKLYSNGKSSFSSNKDGVYIGSDGIKLGDSFSVNSQGSVSLSDANLGGTFNNTTDPDGDIYTTRIDNASLLFYDGEYTDSDDNKIGSVGISFDLNDNADGVGIYTSENNKFSLIHQYTENDEQKESKEYIYDPTADYKHSFNGNSYYNGNVDSYGLHRQVIDTDNYGSIGMVALASMGAFFCDIGSATIGSTGECEVILDAKFKETISTSSYFVFLTCTNDKSIKCKFKDTNKFVVSGDVGATFDWIIYAKQKNYESVNGESIQKPI